jgi:Kef-type K+ transport system membrane component KefB
MKEHILLELALILLAAKIGSELCKRWLKQPAVLGELVFGVLIGQSALGWISGESVVLHYLAEIGAVLLLFESQAQPSGFVAGICL